MGKGESECTQNGKSISLFSLALALAVVVLVSAPTSATVPGKERNKTRTATGGYQTPAPAITPVHPYGVALCNRGGALGESRGCMDFYAEGRERYVSVVVKDASGINVPAFLDMGGNIDEWVPFCGSLTKRQRILTAEFQVWVYAYRSPNLPTCPGAATSGTVEVTFSS